MALMFLMRKKSFASLAGAVLILHTAAFTQTNAVNPNDSSTIGPIWPKAPNIPEFHGIHIFGPKFAAHKNDDFRWLETIGSYQGRIVYFTGYPNYAFVFRKISGELGTQDGGSPVAAYPTTPKIAIFNPLWKTDGRGITFCDGDEHSQRSGAGVYRWDFSTATINSTVGIVYPKMIRSTWDNFLSFVYTNNFISEDPDKWSNGLSVTHIDRRGAWRLLPHTTDIRGSWGRDGKFYYSAKTPVMSLPQSQAKPAPRKRKGVRISKKQSANNRKAVGAQSVASQKLHPDIYEVDVKQGNPKVFTVRGKVIIPDGVNPSISPNGRRIAYTGWLTVDSTGKTVAPGTLGATERYGLCIWEKSTGKRTWLSGQEFAAIKWFPDGRQLLLAQRTDVANFYVVDLNQALTEAAQPNLTPKEHHEFASWSSKNIRVNITYEGFSNDRKYFFFKCEETDPKTGRTLYTERALDVQSGIIESLFDFGDTNVRGFDWHDGSPYKAEAEF